MLKPLALLTALVLLAPTSLPAQTSSVETYNQLLTSIREVRRESEARVQAAVEQEKVREAWETGKLIDEHVLKHPSSEETSKSPRIVVGALATTKERAEYGKQVIERLAGDLGTSTSELYRMLEFYRAYPIFGRARKLSWSHYESLLAINDPQEREAISKEAEEKGWNRDQVREAVREAKAKTGQKEIETPEKLTATPGKVGTYRVILAKAGPYAGQLVLDLGFSDYYRPQGSFPYKEGDIVTIEATSHKDTSHTESPLVACGMCHVADLYTYRAYIYEVIDGDTVNAVIDLGFGFTTTQTLRLRGIDAPELPTAAGKEAKAFVEKALSWPVDRGPCPGFLIKSIKSDKYDRYLADIWVDKDGKQQHLNNLLLEEGLAVAVEG